MQCPTIHNLKNNQYLYRDCARRYQKFSKDPWGCYRLPSKQTTLFLQCNNVVDIQATLYQPLLFWTLDIYKDDEKILENVIYYHMLKATP